MTFLIACAGWCFANPRLAGALALAAALLVSGLWLLDWAGDRREAEIRQEIAHEDDKAAAAAGSARDRVRACYARGELWRWDRATGLCVGNVPRAR